jgi:hypothetical protein
MDVGYTISYNFNDYYVCFQILIKILSILLRYCIVMASIVIFMNYIIIKMFIIYYM